MQLKEMSISDNSL